MKKRSLQGTRSDSVRTARQLRLRDTGAEEAAWQLLRNRQHTGLKFRPQHPLGKYTVDFFCYKLRLAIELDGSAHSQPGQMRHDKIKDQALERTGVQVLRISNGMVLQDPEAFLERIRRLSTLTRPVAADEGAASGPPSPTGEGRCTPSDFRRKSDSLKWAKP